MIFFKIFNKLLHSRFPSKILVAQYFYYFYRLKIFFLKQRGDKTKPIKISLLMISLDVWKYTSLVKNLIKDGSFEVKVIICPFTSQGEYTRRENEKQSIFYFNNLNIPVLVGQEDLCEADEFLLKSDVVFYFNPNKHTIEKYMYYNWLHKFTCFIIYSYRVSSYYKYEYGNRVMTSCWRNYVESDYHKNLSIKYGNLSKNLVVSGYVSVDDYKIKIEALNIKPKVFLYAPHWTIPGAQSTGHDWSTFLDYFELIFSFFIDNKDRSELIFRPHPMLKTTLESDKVWGYDKTQIFFNNIKQLSNVKISVNESYEELFNISDALIHDSGGFMVEYLLQRKPCGFLINENFNASKYNDFGKRALDAHYILKNNEEVFGFLKSISQGQLLIKSSHQEILDILFSEKHPSDKIINDIKSNLWLN